MSDICTCQLEVGPRRRQKPPKAIHSHREPSEGALTVSLAIRSHQEARHGRLPHLHVIGAHGADPAAERHEQQDVPRDAHLQR